MIRLMTTFLCLAAVAVGAVYTQRLVQQTERAEPVRHTATAPTIEKVRRLASLVTLDVPISNIGTSELSGLTGGIELAVAVHGDVQIAADLERARFDDLDAERQSVILLLPRPSVTRPRIDHEKTRILEIRRTGLWRFKLGQANEDVLNDSAMRVSQRVLAEAADQPELIAKACAHTEEVMRHFFGALGWQVVIQWDDTLPADGDSAAPDLPTASAAR